MKHGRAPRLVAIAGLLLVLTGSGFARTGPSPLEFLKVWEWAHRDAGAEVYLGKVITVRYEPYAVEPPDAFHPYLLELTDVIKTPLRSNYRLLLKGYTDTSGDREANLRISRKRAETLKQVLIDRYYMDRNRITAEGYGPADPVASNDTASGRGLNRRVEIHVYGDPTQAVRFMSPEEESQ